MPMYGNMPIQCLGGFSAGTSVYVAWLTDTIKTALVTSGYTPAQGSDLWWSTPAANETTGTGYTAGGQTLTSPTVTYTSGTKTSTFSAAQVNWTTSTITARYAVVYKSTGTNSTSPLVCYFDFGGNQSSSAGTFSVVWNASGIFTVTVT